MFYIEEASLSIKQTEYIEEEDIIEVNEGDILYSISSYRAEADQAIDLVEGERVYVIDNDNADWWYVKKHLTEEKGWVPAQYLMDEENYTIFVQKKLHEKIDKLPVFERKYNFFSIKRSLLTSSFQVLNRKKRQALHDLSKSCNHSIFQTDTPYNLNVKLKACPDHKSHGSDKRQSLSHQMISKCFTMKIMLLL